ncbi:MFS transporter [Cohnella sp. CBP 2801]|uniref:MFS transporter n=1 Tax=Cohnella zeiphila TaxID=2761120 RepID=A0A7X0SPT3_9BACL|nr:MFS transporter [Cohnella zeiphila]
MTIGLGELVLGAILEPMVHAYGVQYSDGGQLVMNQFLGGLFGTLCAPWLIRRMGRKALLLSAFGVMTAMEIAYTALPPWGAMLTIAPVTGFSFGVIETLVGSLVISGAGANANVAMTRVETFFGVGALIVPFAGAALIEAGQWRLSFGVVGVLAVLSFALWLRFWPKQLLGGRSLEPAGEADASAASGDESSNARAGRSVVGGPGFILAICALFFAAYVGVEMSFTHYLPSLLVKSNGLSDATATLALAAFWGAMTIGRLFAGRLADRIGGAVYLVASCLASIVCFLLMSVTSGAPAMFVLAFLAGLSMSGIFAIALVFANQAVPGITERTTSVLIACGLLGGGLVPKITGWCLDEYGTTATKWLFAGTAVLMLAIIGVAVYLYRRARRSVVLLEGA